MAKASAEAFRYSKELWNILQKYLIKGIISFLRLYLRFISKTGFIIERMFITFIKDYILISKVYINTGFIWTRNIFMTEESKKFYEEFPLWK